MNVVIANVSCDLLMCPNVDNKLYMKYGLQQRTNAEKRIMYMLVYKEYTLIDFLSFE